MEKKKCRSNEKVSMVFCQFSFFAFTFVLLYILSIYFGKVCHKNTMDISIKGRRRNILLFFRDNSIIRLMNRSFCLFFLIFSFLLWEDRTHRSNSILTSGMVAWWFWWLLRKLWSLCCVLQKERKQARCEINVANVANMITASLCCVLHMQSVNCKKNYKLWSMVLSIRYIRPKTHAYAVLSTLRSQEY